MFRLHDICSVDSQKIIKIVATRCQILRLKCTKFDFGWGFAPDPARGPQTPLAGFEGLLLREGRGGKRGRDERGGEGGEGMGGEGGRRREGRGLSGNVAEEAFCLKSAPGADR